VRASLVIADILGDRVKDAIARFRDAGTADEEAVWLCGERIAAEVDALVVSTSRENRAIRRPRCRLLRVRQPSPDGDLQ